MGIAIMTQDNLATRHTIRVNEPIELPSPTAQQIRKYAATHKILVEFYEADSEQMMFNHLYHACLMKGARELKERELYDAIIKFEV
jgi:hypothetical protein